MIDPKSLTPTQLHALRKYDLRLTQTELAELLETTPSVVSAVETGKRRPPVRYAALLLALTRGRKHYEYPSRHFQPEAESPYAFDKFGRKRRLPSASDVDWAKIPRRKDWLACD